MRLSLLASVTAIAALSLTPAIAQRRPPTPEQRIERLEKQVRQVQGRVFPKGQPADTAGFVDDPAATQDSVNSLAGRLESIERAMAEITRTSEENANRVATMEAELARLRADQDRRLRALETAPAEAEPTDRATAEPGSADQDAAEPDPDDAPPPAPRPKVETPRAEPASAPIRTPRPADAGFDAAGEEAYDQGYQLWTAGKYDQAITALRAMASSFPGHRRVSWANNLTGRALLDKGQPRAAAEALLANYRGNPKGERAPDSLFYLGQALVKLRQSGQACKAYDELSDVYGATMRQQLKTLLPSARAEAKCS